MTEFLVFGLIVAVLFLWSRLQKVEQRLQAVIDQSRERFQAIEARLEDAVPPVTDAPAAPQDAPDTEPEPRLAEPAPQVERAETIAYAQGAEVEVPEAGSQTQDLPPETTEVPDDDPDQGAPATAAFDFEDIFGRRLPIWAGGIALAIAGIFLVRYAIEAGLFTPVFRVVASFVFGFGLIGGAEFAHRNQDKVADPRVAQALAGAGIATLFGAFYLAGTGYGLIGPPLAFAGLACVTAGAIALSFRFGLPCAVLGLVGGFAAPVMVQSDGANVPLLALYLALVTGGLAWTGVKQGQRWLGYVALAIGLGWGFVIQVAGLGGSGDLIAMGGYLIVLGTVLPAFLYDRQGPGAVQLIAGAAATLQMAMLVSQGGFEPLTWALYLLIAAALAALGWRFADLRPGSAIAALIGFWLLSIWPDAATGAVFAVAVMMVLIFFCVPMIHIARRQSVITDWGQIALGAVGIGAALAYQLALAPVERSVGDFALAACLAGLALFPVAAFALHWRREAALDLRLAPLVLGSSYVLIFPALLLVSPPWLAPVMAGALAVVAVGMLWQREDTVLRIAAWATIAVTAFALIATPDFEQEFRRLGDLGLNDAPARAVIRWAALLPGLLAMAVIRARDASRLVADGLAELAAFGTLAQVVPGEALPALAAFGGALVFSWKPERIVAWGVALLIAAAWALEPLVIWLAAGGEALVGMAFMAGHAVAAMDIALRLAPAAVLATLVTMRGADLPREARLALAALPVSFALIALHSLYKQVFAIESMLRFEQWGMAERSVWQALLLMAGIGIAQLDDIRLSHRVRQILSTSLVGASLAHFVWFTLLLHNPLHSAQHVGPTPVANLLLLAYGTAIAAIISLRPSAQTVWEKARLACDCAMMTLIALLAISLLRQVFAGSLLIATGIGSGESLLLSLLGIALALGFLWWGSLAGQRSWRIGSLVLILLAVLKVFLIDAAGLEGLLRIASFMALGFSLIGIGWVYSRQLRSRPAVPHRSGEPDPDG